ncbi:MAG: Xaa-Pro peptidase family protein [Chloroflexota bacterium]
MYSGRLNRLQAALRGQGVDCLALLPGPDLRYLTGFNFHLMERPTVGFFPSEGIPFFVIPVLELSAYDSGVPYEASDFAWADGEGPEEAFQKAFAELPEVHTLAVPYLGMRVLELRLIQRHVPNAMLVDGGPLMDSLRLIKDEMEVGHIKAAIQITEGALESVLKGVKPGMTERQVAKQLEIAQLERGGGLPPFEVVALSGPYAALPHGASNDRAIQPGDVLLIDMGTTASGYCSDLTRTVFVSREPGELMRAVYQAVEAANAAGRAAAGPGVPCQEVDRAARRVIEDAGFGDYFIHRTGHGIGMGIHEAPSVVAGNTQVLQAGMVITVEPGIYLPGEVGVRIEDDVLITEDGAISLTTFPRELTIVGLAE